MFSNHQRIAALLAALLVLSGCHRAVAPSPSSSPAPSPGQAETVTPAPPATSSPEPSEEPGGLWGFPVDEDHDAFEVDTKGALGTVLVTVEKTQESAYDGATLCRLSVWTKDDLTTPLQQMELHLWSTFGGANVVDANFDGHMDFTYRLMLSAKSAMASLWLWDEEAGQFVEEPEYANIPNPLVDPESQTISGVVSYSAAGDGEERTYRWENGHLVCVQRVEYTYPDEAGNREKVTYQRLDGALVEISREPMVVESAAWEAQKEQ